ncbi:DNA-processing protein DprA [Kyrpidia tusciae]|uniref:DNA protecting protein DprA n=1 Tax=Kyrpidia tusciae (strain DSM 2912 / NBRC 15312 / T2) TaxID=562970 RepID=D5WPD8_KYRT2|nr:DNA-processing protein DprA [Kyrpidia tusciae]ADG06197.1 DNA protecting protein DprA [Kyrpidia tusciae DSM 2912]
MREGSDEWREERAALLTLSRVEGVGPGTLSVWKRQFGTFRSLWSLSEVEIASGLGQRGTMLAGRIVDARRRGPEGANLEEWTPYGAMWTTTLLDPDYPGRLRSLRDAPWVLYGVGNPGVLKDDLPALAVVGTRRPTMVGRRVARLWSADLARRGVVIVSGLARGIDGLAHMGALEGGGRTIAVLAGGFHHLYPPEHRSLAAAVARSGALISEQPPHCQPRPGLFPIRNRIISGLAEGVLVVEAGATSGALKTVDHALDQGRDVFAVPGSVAIEASRGTNLLIRDGAKPAMSPDDVAAEYPHWPAALAASADGEIENQVPRRTVDSDSRRVLAALEEGCRTPDLIAGRTGLRLEHISRVLTDLELAGRIYREPGGLYGVVPFWRG